MDIEPITVEQLNRYIKEKVKNALKNFIDKL